MGDFRIVIDAVGGHGQDREKGDGEVVDFGTNTPEAIAKQCVDELKAKGTNVTRAEVIHWPVNNYPDNRKRDIKDDLLTGVRRGSFKDDLTKEA